MTADNSPSNGIIVEQAIFGYSNGHQLLSSTTKFDQETLTMLVRLTDGTGAESLSQFDGYLSGYPLPDGRYALTRTYRDATSTRPGAVWTHALLIDRRDLAYSRSMWELYECTRIGFEISTPVLEQLHLRSRDYTPEPVHLPRLWNAVVSELISSGEPSVAVTTPSGMEYEQAVIALWSWMWPAVRADFTFCLGAMGARNLRPGRTFDFLAIPRSRSSSKRAESLVVDPTTVSPAGRAIAEDLHSLNGSSLRAYVSYCGAESARRSAMSLITNIWLVATREDVDLDARQIAVAEAACSKFPEPRSMRRLKSSVLANTGRLPVTWRPDTTLELLSVPIVARSVLVNDVPLEGLLKRVEDQPIHLLELAASTSASNLEPGSSDPFPDGTIAAVLPLALERQAFAELRPTMLKNVIEVNPAAASRMLLLVDEGSRSSWAQAHWGMTAKHQDEFASAYIGVVRSRPTAGSTLSSRTAGWLAYYAPNVSAGLNWLETCHPNKTTRKSALEDLARSVLSEDWHAGRWRASVASKTLVEAACSLLKQGSVPVVTGVLILIEPDAGLSAGIGLDSWERLYDINLSPIAAAHLLRYSRHRMTPTRHELEMSCHAYALVWSALALSNQDCWEALADYPARPEPAAEWDRAMRLTITFAESVRHWSQSLGPDVREACLDNAGMSATPAAQQLHEVLVHPPRMKPPPQPKQPPHRPSRLDQFRNTVSDIKSIFW